MPHAAPHAVDDDVAAICDISRRHAAAAAACCRCRFTPAMDAFSRAAPFAAAAIRRHALCLYCYDMPLQEALLSLRA